MRWTRPSLDSELRALADSALGVQDAPANISVVLGEARDRTQIKHQVYAQGKALSVVRGDGALVRTIVRVLGALATDSPPGSLSLDVLLVVEPGGTAIAVDGKLWPGVQRLEPKLRHRGRRVLRLPRLAVWPDRGTAALPDAATAVGLSAEALNARWPARPGDDDLAGGEVAITRLIYAGLPEPGSRGDVVAAMVPMARDPTGRVARADVAGLAGLAARVDVTPVVSGNRLAELLGL